MPSAAAVGSDQLGKASGEGKESFNQRSPESLDEMTAGSVVPVFKPVAPFLIKKWDSGCRGQRGPLLSRQGIPVDHSFYNYFINYCFYS